MENSNKTSTDFFLLGLSPPSGIGLFFFIFVFLIFLMALCGNLSMIIVILLDIHLHTPMYFLLIHSFLFITLAGAEGLLLARMAYDRYVAICFPLHYAIHMTKRVCVLMITGSWIMSSINSCAHTVYALHIPYCQSRTINHFFCDVPAMLTLACMDIWVYEYTVFVSTTLFLVLPFTGIACSYGRVLLTICRIHSTEGRKKAYSTCSTHLTVVTFYYAPFAYTYLHPRSLRTPTEDKILAVFYTILTPMLNPIIYSLRNKEVMGTLRRLIQRICSV
uniref:G-protein coupled receptors family 1 profile domain-containing protein n=1 Tax=Panthera tigris altaica TaxID=74533 RepID=A0A8C9M1W0_PANTA